MMYHKRGLDFVWLVMKMDENKDKYIEELTTAATDFKGKYSFLYLDDDKQPGMKEQFGIKDLPGVVISNVTTNKNFVFSEEFNAANLKAFVTKQDSKELKPTIKSADVPEGAAVEEEGVYVLVGKSFQAEAIDQDGDVFVFFYAPWCGHCNKAKPGYESLVKKYKDANVSGIRIAKFDATANDVDHDKVNIQGFPTFYLFKKGDKENPVL